MLKTIAGINQIQIQDMEGGPVWSFCRTNGNPAETKCRQSIRIQIVMMKSLVVCYPTGGYIFS